MMAFISIKTENIKINLIEMSLNFVPNKIKPKHKSSNNINNIDSVLEGKKSTDIFRKNN